MKALLPFFLLLISTNIFAQEILFEPVFFDQCTAEKASYVDYYVTDSSATYPSKRNTKYLILPKKGTYWLYIKGQNYDELPMKLTLENEMNVDSFYSTRRMEFNHSCQRLCQDIFDKKPENFIGKYNSHYKLCDKTISNKLMFDLYFNDELRIIGAFNENGQPIDTLKKYYNTGALAELAIYNSEAKPQLLLSYYENGILKTKLDFVTGEKQMNYPSGSEKLKRKFKVSSYNKFGEGLDTLKKYYDSGALRELIAYDLKNQPQLILSYYENGLVKAKIDVEKGRGLAFFPSGKGRIRSTFRRLPPYAVFAVNIKEYYENGQLKSNGEYARRRLEAFYDEENHKTLGVDGSTYFESYYEDGQPELMSRGKESSEGLDTYYKNGQLKLTSKGENRSGGLKAYYENGQLKRKERPKIKRIYNLDKQLVERIRKKKRVYSYFELETFLITYTPYYNWKWTTFDSLGKKKRKILYSPVCDSPNCPFPDSLLNSKLDTDSFYKILIFEAGKLYQKIEANSEELTLYERKNKKWTVIKRLPKESIYELMKTLGADY